MLTCIPYAVHASDANPYQKIVMVNLVFENNLVRVESSEIQYGTAPALNIQSGTIKGILSDSKDHTLNEFYIRDPRVLTGESVTGNPDGTKSIHGYMEYVQPVEFGIVLPFTNDLRSLRLVDTTTGSSLATVDLTNDIAQFAQAYPDDPDIQALANQGKMEDAGFNWTPPLILGSFLGVVSVFGYFVHSRGWGEVKSHVALEKQKIRGEYLYSTIRDAGAGFVTGCQKVVDALYHSSLIVNFGIILLLIFIMVFSPVPVYILNSESPPVFLLAIIEVLTFYLLATSLVTTHRSLVSYPRMI
jgi:hypothetical protein